MKPGPLSHILALAALVLALIGSGGAALAAKWGKNYFPNLPVVTQDGVTLRFYDDLLKDKIVVIDFVYTSCIQICPVMTARMAELQDRLGDRVGRDIHMYSISIDPERDSPDALKAYAEAFDVGPGWLFLTGEPAELKLIRYKLGERSRSLSEHRGIILLGNAKTGEWQRSSSFQDTDLLVQEVNRMDPTWRAMARKRAGPSYASVQPVTLERSPGLGFFNKACASCHTIGGGDKVGPDLMGLTARRDRDWLFRFLKAPERLRAEKDPIALAVAAKYKGVMPNMTLSDTDISDLLAFIESREKKAKAAADDAMKRGAAKQITPTRPDRRTDRRPDRQVRIQ